MAKLSEETGIFQSLLHLQLETDQVQVKMLLLI